MRSACLLAAALSGLLCALAGPAAAQWSGEARARRDVSSPNDNSGRRQGSRLNPAVQASDGDSGTVVEATARGRWKAVNANLEWREGRRDGGRRPVGGRVKELYALVPLGNASVSAGRRSVEWDVGFGFRPNDIVQQDTVAYRQRGLFSTSPIGRYVVQVDQSWADGSLSLVWLNPQRAGRRVGDGRSGGETALAAMAYRRAPGVDLYLFGRYGRATRASVGASFSAVVSESVSVYGSARYLRRHDGWLDELGASATLADASPWRQSTLGPAAQGLLGANWTGAARQSLTFEWWYDGTTLSDAQWRTWQDRKNQLAGLGLRALQGDPDAGPGEAVGANLAWHDLPLSVLNQRRQTLFLRLAWQPEPWLAYVDSLYSPADGGRVHTAGLQWQGDRLRLDAAYRWYQGPSDALATQLPTARAGLVAVSLSY